MKYDNLPRLLKLVYLAFPQIALSMIGSSLDPLLRPMNARPRCAKDSVDASKYVSVGISGEPVQTGMQLGRLTMVRRSIYAHTHTYIYMYICIYVCIHTQFIVEYSYRSISRGMLTSRTMFKPCNYVQFLAGGS